MSKDGYNIVAQKLYDSLSFRPYCGYEKCAHLIRARKSAIKYPYIVLNLPVQVAWLTFDLDHSDMMAWERQGLPEPNFIVRDRQSGNGHITYAIESVCRSANASQAPLRYLKAIQRTMTRLLKADSAFANHVTKNPFSERWLTTWLHDKSFSLGDLHEYLPDTLDLPTFNASEALEIDVTARNCSVFDLTRHWAYRKVHLFKTNSTEREWERTLLDKAQSFANEVVCPKRGSLPFNEISSIARSVSRWTWNHYVTSTPTHRGIMSLDKDLTGAERRKLGAEYTHQVRREKTESKVRQAIQELLDKEMPVTKTAVANITGISRQHISQKFSYLFSTVNLDNNLISVNTEKSSFPVLFNNKNGENKLDKSVNYAVHQVTAPLEGTEENKQPLKPTFEGIKEERKGFFEKKACFQPEEKECFILQNNQNKASEGFENSTPEKIHALLDQRFQRIDELLDWMLKIPKLDDLPQPFGFELRLSIAKLLVDDLRLKQEHCIDVILQIMIKALEEPQRGQHSYIRWKPYIIGIGKRIFRDYPDSYGHTKTSSML